MRIPAYVRWLDLPFSRRHLRTIPVTALLSILFASFHLVDDIVYGSEKGVVSNLLMVTILALWLYGTLILTERPAGQIIMLLGSLLGLTVFLTHLTGAGGLAGIRIGKILALAVVSLLSLAVCAQGLLSLSRPKAPQ